ncbi:transposable element Tcb2 transposase [Trichonephila clavipes]|nr:transposable element Tcb2 transposase [Trichonephila clavipes]
MIQAYFSSFQRTNYTTHNEVFVERVITYPSSSAFLPSSIRPPSTYASTTAECSSSSYRSCLGKRAQRPECRGLERVAWSDESRFRLFKVDGRLRIWGQTLGAMNPACQSYWVITSIRYPRDNGVFQQDNCTSNKSRLATGCLDEHSSDFSVIKWPPKSPDLNPIEHLNDVLEQDVKGHHTAPTNLIEPWTALVNIWQVFPVERFQKLIGSMPRRVATTINARGVPTRCQVGKKETLEWCMKANLLLVMNVRGVKKKCVCKSERERLTATNGVAAASRKIIPTTSFGVCERAFGLAKANLL